MSEQNCIHEEVCRFREKLVFDESLDEICTLREMCKFYEVPPTKFSPARVKEEPAKPRRKKKRKYRKKARKKVTTSKEDIARVRNRLRMRRKDGLLTADQIRALDVHAGKRYKELSETEKQQILDIEKESKNRMEDK